MHSVNFNDPSGKRPSLFCDNFFSGCTGGHIRGVPLCLQGAKISVSVQVGLLSGSKCPLPPKKTSPNPYTAGHKRQGMTTPMVLVPSMDVLPLYRLQQHCLPAGFIYSLVIITPCIQWGGGGAMLHVQLQRLKLSFPSSRSTPILHCSANFAVSSPMKSLHGK